MWVKHIYEYSKLTEISTVWKSRVVQSEVCTREKRLSFNTKKQCAKNALCFSFCMALFIQFFERNQLHPFIRLRIESTP